MKHNLKITWEKLTALVAQANTILLTTHVNPDGDGIGSELALYYYFKKLNKDCRIINISPLPYQYEYYNGNDIFQLYDDSCKNWISKVDLAFILDIGDVNRLGDIEDILTKDVPTICIDHHPLRNENTYSYIIIDESAPATGFIIWQYFRHLFGDAPLPKIIADALYAALITDTGSFRYSNTNIDAHKMAIHLIGSGTKPHVINSLIYEQKQLHQVKLLGKIIDALQFSDDKKIVWFRITPEMLSLCGAKLDDVDGYTDFVRSIGGVEIAFMMLVVEDGNIRLNFRSKGKYSVNDVAGKFGGGGHKFAAGATARNQSIEQVETEILKYLKEKINGDHLVN